MALIEPHHDFVDFGRDRGELVTRHGEDPARHEDSRGLAEERVVPEPVQRLRDAQRVGRGVFGGELLGGRTAVLDPWMGPRTAQLRLARVESEHALEMFGERDGGLAVARADVDRELRARRARGQPRERGPRIVGR